MSMTPKYCLGIDGGGTKTEGVLTDRAGKVLGVCRVGSSNPNDIGIEAAGTVLADLIKNLLTKAGVASEDVSVFAGVSGALAVREALTEAVTRRLPAVSCLSVHSDVINLLSAESPSGDGVCLICGTGSVCFARHGDTLCRVGGWGYLLDSAGSGYDVGRMALEAALKAADGRADQTHAPLYRAVTAYLGASPDQCIPMIYEKGKPLIASCAPLVFQLAKSGDPVAAHILDVNAQALATCLHAAKTKMPFQTSVKVVMGGSICVKEAPDWTHRIEAFLSPDDRKGMTLQIAEAPPVFGALAEARAMTDVSSRTADFAAFRQTFLDTYSSSC